ncbi:uncharacterized protein BO88DRAFT_63789 [Aspergillus vadensis CBS 113365]|uniref:Uncharacterized protein n=1 Tax=Aspergillus vadensis (strain CBS 113365 / IMI 142717 / IBT 24658) TaxID=1448311 RepID=A0A319B8F2_ASPVC|nr:hypothetical protein BO88DRAFT_63789 [Aspergillus vadensis CBS 113365]PYH68104.1 hypothetical protein BO88DRAFT_63789 [Aspergillus vadensis CBS 113365]
MQKRILLQIATLAALEVDNARCKEPQRYHAKSRRGTPSTLCLDMQTETESHPTADCPRENDRRYRSGKTMSLYWSIPRPMKFSGKAAHRSSSAGPKFVVEAAIVRKVTECEYLQGRKTRRSKSPLRKQEEILGFRPSPSGLGKSDRGAWLGDVWHRQDPAGTEES